MAKQAKKPTKQQHSRHQKQHRIIVGLSIVVVAVLVGLILSLIIIPKVVNDTRLRRINEIYSSIGVDTNSNYVLQRENVFGDKRVYSYDVGRTFSSEKDYVRGANVDVTAKELDTAVKAAGFTLIGQPYAGSTETQYQYKDSRGEYVRVTVTSKLRDDAFRNSYLMTKKTSPDDFKIDPNAGPSNVILKVNLDDNNE
jgi:hypothetical protein